MNVLGLEQPIFFFSLEGTRLRKTSLADKVPKTLYNKKFMEFFSYIEDCLIFGRKSQVGDLFTGDAGFHSV